MSSSSRTGPRHSREEWLARALDVLAREGEAKIRIDALVKKLGVTKGSFYWHFKNRDDFLTQLVRYWAETSTRPVIEHMDALDAPPAERLYALMEYLFATESAGYDLAIRALAAHEPHVRPLVRKLDQQRYNYVGGIFRDLGFDGDELAMRTRTFVVFQSLELGVLAHGSKTERRRLLDLRHAFFTRT